ncbi:unnamed protein product [Prunus armeniaca]
MGRLGIINIQIAQGVIERLQVDESNITSILQLSVVQQMGMVTKINKSATSLTDIYDHRRSLLYNGILGRPWIGKINAITLATHQKMHYPISRVVLGWRPKEDVELIPIDPDKPERKARISSLLSLDEKLELTTSLKNNKDLLAWSPSDMPEIDPHIICHRLHVNPTSKPVKQKRRNLTPERIAIIEKDQCKWRVCVNYTDLNKACPNDNFPLPRIDQLIDTTSGNQLLNFMDTSSSYNQIMMHEDDKVKTSFIIEKGTYCYKVIPFGLKNAGATYQRLMNKIFKEHIDKTMEDYVDNMLVKAPQQANHIKNLVEAFVMLRKYRLKLNLSKSHLESHPANFWDT